jgi:hypothetical protein
MLDVLQGGREIINSVQLSDLLKPRDVVLKTFTGISMNEIEVNTLYETAQATTLPKYLRKVMTETWSQTLTSTQQPEQEFYEHKRNMGYIIDLLLLMDLDKFNKDHRLADLQFVCAVADVADELTDQQVILPKRGKVNYHELLGEYLGHLEKNAFLLEVRGDLMDGFSDYYEQVLFQTDRDLQLGHFMAARKAVFEDKNNK